MISQADAIRIGNQLGLDWGVFNPGQFWQGMNVELEHGSRYGSLTNVTDDNLLTTGRIAIAHLLELPDYYSRLAKMESSNKRLAYANGYIKGYTAFKAVSSLADLMVVTNAAANAMKKPIMLPLRQIWYQGARSNNVADRQRVEQKCQEFIDLTQSLLDSYNRDTLFKFYSRMATDSRDPASREIQNIQSEMSDPRRRIEFDFTDYLPRLLGYLKDAFERMKSEEYRWWYKHDNGFEKTWDYLVDIGGELSFIYGTMGRLKVLEDKLRSSVAYNDPKRFPLRKAERVS